MAARRALLFVAATSLACTATQYGATDANFARAQTAESKGAALFKQQCAGCHGERGESATGAPRVMGEGALPEMPRPRNVNADPAAGDRESLRLEARSRPAGAPWRDPFRTAADLHAFVSKNMPPSEKQREAISAADYWAIVSFMLVAHGAPVPSGGVNASNASSVKLR